MSRPRKSTEEKRDPKELTPKRKRQRAFLAKFSEIGTIWGACRSVGMDRKTFYKWRNGDPWFVDMFADAENEVTEKLEQNILRLAVSENNVVANIFLLKARKPEMYSERIRSTISVEQGVVDGIVKSLLAILNRYLPDACPSCRSVLDVKSVVARALTDQATVKSIQG